MKLLINSKKEIVNLFWKSEAKEAVEVDVSGINNLEAEHLKNIEFKRLYGISKYYLDDNNELQERTEESPEVVEAINKKVVEQRRARYITEVDPYKLEALDDDLSGAEKAALKQKAKDNKQKIKQDLPKKGVK